MAVVIIIAICHQGILGVTMTAAEILQSVQFIVNHEGKPTAVVLHIEAWEAIVALLEDIEDTGLTQQTGQDETTILTRALHLGLDLLYRQAVEQAFIDETLSRDQAVAILGEEHVEEVEYAKRALAQDVARV